MHIHPHILDSHGVYPKYVLEDGNVAITKTSPHDELDPRLVEEVDRESDLTTYTGYLATEFHAGDDMTTGATLQVLFSKRRELAAIFYDHPNISAPFIEWVFCSSPDDALLRWRKKVRLPVLLETSSYPIDLITGT